ncbi:Major cardiolipin synthase ClsA [Paraburkholderia kirstenboschensis]|uniref:phospholipase D-like domain-containing protein n=1 Tax=Paraburkholderia kirstenboschensis TaxID=1245436 RepID=UPI000B0D3CD8|nr:phospholipase D-like domain-containing protein [Paraburkholderia kirstenboschensis]CAD6552642.1 Major cardiolipin synthase ClsA [Paraburkholderia kirstenboschensis]
MPTIALIILTVAVTLVVVLVVANLTSGEKKIEHKIERLYASDDPQFTRSMGLLLGPPVIGGNHFQVLVNGDEIFPSMMEGILSAQHTITFETFIYWSGAIGEKIAHALSEKARAGVAVHVLLDWVGSSKMDKRYLQMLRDAGAEVIQYHKPHWTGLGRMNDRTHRKLLVIDGRIGYTGGVGIADEWTGHAQDEKHWRDTHFRVAGPAVGQMQAVFMDNWVKATGNVLHGSPYFPEIDAAGDGLAHMFSSSACWGDLLEAGVEIYEYQPTMFHCKLIVVDEFLVSVGSTNFDSRSFKLNDEANLNIYDRDFARQQTAIFDNDVVHAKRITLEDWRRRPLAEKLLERTVALLDPQL